MDDYLKGFIDGYKKAMEMQKRKSVCIDGKKIAEEIYPEIKLLSEQEKRIRSNFNAK